MRQKADRVRQAQPATAVKRGSTERQLSEGAEMEVGLSHQSPLSVIESMDYAAAALEPAGLSVAN